MARKNISNYLAKFKRSKGNISKNLLYNVYVLYFFLFVSVVFLYGLVEVRDFNSVAIFILIGFVTTFFSKNMVVIMAVAIIFTALLKTTKSSLEGFQEGALADAATASSTPSANTSSSNSTTDSSNPTSTTSVGSDSAPSSAPGSTFPRADAVTGPMNAAKSNSDKKEKIDKLMKDTKALKELEKQANDLLDVQQQILSGLEKMEPMLTKAEGLTAKLEGFGKH